jgi:hypothetical protein
MPAFVPPSEVMSNQNSTETPLLTSGKRLSTQTREKPWPDVVLGDAVSPNIPPWEATRKTGDAMM